MKKSITNLPLVQKKKKQLIAGNPTKYDEEKHIGLLVDVLYIGDDIAAFCAEAMISKTTFHNWRKKHPKFTNAYDIMINYAECIWEKMPFEEDTKDINYHHWFMIMKNRFGYGKSRFTISEGKDPLEIIDSVLDALGNGEITTQEATQIANLASVKVNIKANSPHEEGSKDTIGIRTPEQLQKTIDLMQQVIDAQTGGK